MRLKIGKRGNILTENIISIVLTLVFITIVTLFLFIRMSGDQIIEERYAKQIALAIDAAEPGMVIYLKMEDAAEAATENGIPPETAVKITDNIVTIKLREKGGYTYSFFNDVKVTPNFKPDTKEYYFVIEKNEN